MAYGPVTAPVSRLTLALLSSLLVVLSLPDPDWWWLSWVCLVPLTLAVRDWRPGWSFLTGLLFGAAAIFGTCRWIFNVPGFGLRQALPIAVSCGLFPAVWSLAAARPFPSAGRRIAALAPLWILLDFGKTHVGFLSFPWAPLAWSQHANLPLLQLASVTGEYGITFLVVVANLALAEAIATRNWRPPVAACVVLAVVHLWGVLQIDRPEGSRTIRVASVQPSIPSAEGWQSPDGERILARLRTLTLEAATAAPSLVVWPENAVRMIPVAATVAGPVAETCREAGVPLIAGVAEMDKAYVPGSDGRTMSISPAARNDAWFLLPDGTVAGRYSKTILLPFSEYLPLQPAVRWPQWLVPRQPTGVRGEGPVLFTLPGGVGVAPFICWENIFPAFIRTSAALGPGIFVQLSNEIHWGRSAGGFQHNLASVLRAVEHRIPVVVSSNTGPTAVIDPWGRVVAANDRLFESAVVAADVPLAGAPTLYTRLGNWALYPAAIAFLAAFAAPVRNHLRE